MTIASKMVEIVKGKRGGRERDKVSKSVECGEMMVR
jgi:hypothetical protein